MQINAQLEKLCELLDDELERQENVLSLCKLQGDAARCRDIGTLDARTKAITVLIQEAVTAEIARVDCVKQVIRHYNLPVESQTLSELILHVPEPYRQRLVDFQWSMKIVVAETARIIRENNRIMRRSLGIVNSALNALALCVPHENGTYTDQGIEKQSSNQQPNLLDQRG